jgi:hypothetical protein
MRRAFLFVLSVTFTFVIALAAASPSEAQSAPAEAGQCEQEKSAHPGAGHQMDMGHSKGEDMNAAGVALMEEASGTSRNPASAPQEMLFRKAAGWNLMLHGVLFLADTQQTGPRGADKLFSATWFMGMAEHRVGDGSFVFRAMLSLDPATITERRYPELFQTGETAFGIPMADGQHPHDFFMEIALEYAHPIGEKTMLTLYAAPLGDPALGPVAFPHRASSSEIPQAPLGHHLQDSSHIADEVFTVGLSRGIWGIEASGFHGAEPDENRWNIDTGAVDSWAARVSITPTENWAAQVSLGRLHHPEAAEPGDIVRSTASISYNKAWERGNWASSLIWGRNHKTADGRNINSYLLESTMQFLEKNHLSGRIELVDKDELFAGQPELQQQIAATAGSVFRIGAYTLGYTRDFKLIPHLQTGIGANFTLYSTPSAIKPFYGDHPAGFLIFFRARLKGSAMHHGHAR